jgi:catechol 1,2-dioxygenase
MQRREFIKDSGIFAVGVGMFGSIKWDGSRYIGNAPTTTDILGPFYRPGAPVRVDINPSNFLGEKLHLTGTIYKEDQKTPFKNCLVEVWQCDGNQVYDNTSGDYLYRGAQKTRVDGKYHFITTQPVAYPAAPNSDVYRPAHIHLRISGEGQQDLITQIYFKGDPNIDKDPCASSPLAVNRIITVTKNRSNERQVIFDIVMAREFKPDKTVLEKISGVYAMNDNSFIEFYPDGDLLFMKWNGQIREGLCYKGDNEFIGGISNQRAKFEIQPNGATKVIFHFITVLKKEYNLEGVKTFKYK